MLTTKTSSSVNTALSLSKAKAFFELLKFRLSLLVAFSFGFGYLLAGRSAIDWFTFGMLCLGGFLISGSSSAINQVLERDYDKLMKRTAGRPLPTQRLQVEEAISFAVLTGIAGLMLMLMFTNGLATVLAMVSMVLYSFVYTPLKRVGPIAVFVGAIPGALPPLLGWVAATGDISHMALVIFGIQFIWQFPHFWPIAYTGYWQKSKSY